MFMMQFRQLGSDVWVDIGDTVVDTIYEAVLITQVRIASFFSLTGVTLLHDKDDTYDVFMGDVQIGLVKITKH